jgi:hypothetical protein
VSFGKVLITIAWGDFPSKALSRASLVTIKSLLGLPIYRNQFSSKKIVSEIGWRYKNHLWYDPDIPCAFHVHGD